ncbi:unnamed protein product [Orchesella dallaii]|uniref:Uncharacterized protein n=1 Tax=Orchesella dallaii TaxID=48710 RepID=A0ABP1RWR2_9HEXA
MEILAKFMSQLHFYPLPKPSPKWIHCMFLESLLVNAVYLTYFTSIFLGILNNLTTMSHQVLHSLLGRTLGRTAYWIVFTLFQVLQQGSLNNVTYAILLTFAVRLARIFQSFADDTVEMLEGLTQSWEESRHVQAQAAGKGERLLEEDLKVKCIRHQILVRFKEIKNIFETGDSLMSPLLLNAIVTGTLVFIVCGSKAFVVVRTPLSGIVDVFRVLNCCLFLVVYEIGENVNATVITNSHECLLK